MTKNPKGNEFISGLLAESPTSRPAGMIKEDRWPNPYSGQPLHR